jgi:hypothetical protein
MAITSLLELRGNDNDTSAALARNYFAATHRCRLQIAFARAGVPCFTAHATGIAHAACHSFQVLDHGRQRSPFVSAEAFQLVEPVRRYRRSSDRRP